MRNIIITGGGLNNKGAQAMTFICVNEIKKRFPSHQIILMNDQDFRLPKEIKDLYNFEIVCECDLKCAFFKLGGWYKLLALLRHNNSNNQKICDNIFGNADLMIDVSGYAFGSNWDYAEIRLFLTRFAFAKAYNIPAYLMPQSFGPFDFSGFRGKLIMWMAKYFLSWPQIIYARENEGYLGLKSCLCLNNVEQSCDMVLKCKEVTIEHIYKCPPSIKSFQIPPHSVAIIPNHQNFVYGNENEIMLLYFEIIKILKNQNRFIYLLYHAKEDFSICQKIKDTFQNCSNVIVIEDELSCIEFNNIIRQFDYAIASRFHSVVHAFKNQVPCLVLGWSDKYKTLLELFTQEQYMFDVRNHLEQTEIFKALDILEKNFTKERKKIQKQLATLQTDCLFDNMIMKSSIK